eukprot:3925350-Rhodomonas_salina.1
MVFLDGGVELADVLTSGARRDEVCSVEVSWHVKSLWVDDAFEAKEEASPGAFNELEVLSGEDNERKGHWHWVLSRA